MAKNESKSNNNMTIIIIAVIAVAVIVAIVIALMAGNKGQNGSENVVASEQAQTDNNNKLAQVQSKIDAQEKVINDLNSKLTPLVEERTKLEEELMKLTNSGENTEVPVEAPAEETPSEAAEGEQAPTEATELAPTE